MHRRQVQADLVLDKQTRQRLLSTQQDLVASLEALLFRHDPVGINFENNTDEYRPEAETIVLRLPEAVTERDLDRIIREEFVRWFGADIAGSVGAGHYAQIAHEVWPIWLAHR